MTSTARGIAVCLTVTAASFMLAGCANGRAEDPAAGAPPEAKVSNDVDVTLFKLDHPEQFPLVAATCTPSRFRS